MLTSLQGAIESGLLYALMALGVYITFRILDFPDLTVDGSFTTGAAIGAVMSVNGTPPWIAVICAFIGGAIAGTCTGLLHTKGKINGLLSGIIMMIALYSINLRILGKPNVSLRNMDNVFDGASVLVLAVILAIAVKVLLDLFFKTDMGLSLRATGDNSRMIRSFGANTDITTIFGIALSNALVATSGALIAQQQKFADNSMGIGMIVIGLASVIIGEAIFGSRSIFRATLAVILGAIIYRIIFALALRVEWLEASDMKLITAVIIIFALVLPSARRAVKMKSVARKRTAEMLAKVGNAPEAGGER
ncbi:ABC transporter permease [Paenibacillus harenae]|uniref:ABC transport system permease protein n=1 Tax=Paenibacillus harenae TaxID=306543 RepID=A0ABT9U9T9_PAEHA|nr:ABC transporter permease [Paenibacillus harenae]MDQ0116419.1 putative ABC transport system permease protein [Paenibacillus harenae]